MLFFFFFNLSAFFECSQEQDEMYNYAIWGIINK